MPWFNILQGVAAIVAILVAISLAPIAKLVWQIRTNDLHHLDLKIDANHDIIMGKIEGQNTALEGLRRDIHDVQSSLDTHIQWHLNGGGPR